ncbi:uncharacterized protein PFL1_01339 [Pseudozyma flocculosa PF-1]|uniref:Shr3 amino acid permease chaperone n=1 Tax=Pseudozyma flocculosa TaxID=84751 RepID=A0A5C3EY83_9BASI|nr:uncharacterized protein PFL1_01339 [Pseudozyma flocculosa PF-1]EPQ31150.1 hypothetical protein PFL1_01339 [Pseudozyma flocculosa PF-1]SPO36357.1 uncharacterized protein PSFLO_01828 [Pseudozyma flocculosa]
MGFRTGLIIGSTSFLLGTLAIHWTADHLILWQTPVTHDSLRTAHVYYQNTMVDMSANFSKALHGVGLIGALLLISKALGGRESNWLFDGASLFLFGASGVLYYQKVVPSLRSLPPMSSSGRSGTVDARDATFTPLREIASSHAVLAVALVGVILLQSGQYYSERLAERERIEEDEARIRRRQRRREQEEKEKAKRLGNQGTSSAVAS